ncbi:hypothetical protein [Paracidovorax anthurii]|uniref:hypothetical protein n=1 Tax=Paracidovorax anthurii TaxID=78229 RepID=UPI0011BFA5C8|nr:hypothetical protein [Paracidovorax anthurii]
MLSARLTPVQRINRFAPGANLSASPPGNALWLFGDGRANCRSMPANPIQALEGLQQKAWMFSPVPAPSEAGWRLSLDVKGL